MNKRWTLHVENFAKIKSADVTIAPMMCFVGDNNSGKSYLMSVLWGILSLGKDIAPWQRCIENIRKAIAQHVRFGSMQN